METHPPPRRGVRGREAGSPSLRREDTVGGAEWEHGLPGEGNLFQEGLGEVAEFLGDCGVGVGFEGGFALFFGLVDFVGSGEVGEDGEVALIAQTEASSTASSTSGIKCVSMQSAQQEA